MRATRRYLFAIAALLAADPMSRLSAQGCDARLAVPVEFHTLSNGLRVVLSRDASVPLARVGLYSGAGPRREPRGRGGFAHLFEHLMFEGSTQLGPGEYFTLVTGAGGRFGARTLYDLTKYNVT